MKIKKDYVLREIVDEYVVIPVKDAAINFNGMITLNESAKLLWESLIEEKSEEDLIKVLCDEYQISKEEATIDVKDFINVLKENNLLE
ncbi:MAG: PqqD family protein [Bacilli bacterium]|nr:PqqD family protein [Bacilli bacterium]